MNKVIHVNFSGSNRGKILNNKESIFKKYGVILVRQIDRAIGIGYIIIDTNIAVWCQKNKYDLIFSFLFKKGPLSGQETFNVKFAK